MHICNKVKKKTFEKIIIIDIVYIFLFKIKTKNKSVL